MLVVTRSLIIDFEILILYIISVIYRYILDGFPMTKKQVELMTERSIIPVRVLELDISSKEVMVRGTKDRMAPSR